jgi:hypothetical protein|tara:strand:+ start:1287 stop:2060 length:774 start_codon:yes stop_codon:yes gene_type:complete
MHYKNDKMIPLPVVRGIQHSWGYSKGDADFSVTELLQPPKVRALKIQHKDKLVEDYSDSIASFIGNCVHKMLEDANAKSEDLITEMRINTSIIVDGTIYSVSGCVDLINKSTNTLSDYKTTSAYAVTGTSEKPEWDQQLNIYAWLYAQEFDKEELPQAEIIAVLKDWSKSRAKNSNTYPPSAIFVKPIMIWEKKEIEEFVRERIRLHTNALTDTQDIICSDEERWLSKKGKANRCEDWCNVNQFCNQYKNYMEENND